MIAHTMDYYAAIKNLLQRLFHDEWDSFVPFFSSNMLDMQQDLNFLLKKKKTIRKSN